MLFVVVSEVLTSVLKAVSLTSTSHSSIFIFPSTSCRKMTGNKEKKGSQNTSSLEESDFGEGIQKKQGLKKEEKDDDTGWMTRRQKRSSSDKKKKTVDEMGLIPQNSNATLKENTKDSERKGKSIEEVTISKTKSNKKKKKKGKKEDHSTTSTSTVTQHEIPSMSTESFPALLSTITFPTFQENDMDINKSSSTFLGKALINTVKSSKFPRKAEEIAKKVNLQPVQEKSNEAKEKIVVEKGVDLAKYNYLTKKKLSILSESTSSISEVSGGRREKKKLGFVREDNDFVRSYEGSSVIEEVQDQLEKSGNKIGLQSRDKSLSLSKSFQQAPLSTQAKSKRNGKSKKETLITDFSSSQSGKNNAISKNKNTLPKNSTKNQLNIEEIDEASKKKKFEPIVSKKKFKTLPRLKKRILLERLEIYRQSLEKDPPPEEAFIDIDTDTEIEATEKIPHDAFKKEMTSVPNIIEQENVPFSSSLNQDNRNRNIIDDGRFRYVLVFNKFAPLECLEDEEERIELQANAMLLCTEFINQSEDLIFSVQIEYPEVEDEADNLTKSDNDTGNILVEFKDKSACLNAYEHLQGQTIQGEELMLTIRCLTSSTFHEETLSVGNSSNELVIDEMKITKTIDDINQVEEVAKELIPVESPIDLLYQPLNGSVLVLHKFVETEEEVSALLEDDDEYLEYLENVHDLCGIYGKVLSVRLIKESPPIQVSEADEGENQSQPQIGDIWVEYKQPLEAAKAKLHLNNKMIAGNLLMVSVLPSSLSSGNMDLNNSKKVSNNDDSSKDNKNNNILVFQEFAAIEDLEDDEEYEELLQNISSLCSVFGIIKSTVFPRQCQDPVTSTDESLSRWQSCILVGDVAVEFEKNEQACSAYTALKDIIVQGCLLKLYFFPEYSENIKTQKEDTEVLIKQNVPSFERQIFQRMDSSDRVSHQSSQQVTLTTLEKHIQRLKLKANPRMPPKYRIASVAPKLRSQNSLIDCYLPRDLERPINQQITAVPLFLMTDEMIYTMKLILNILMSIQERARHREKEELEKRKASGTQSTTKRFSKKIDEDDEDFIGNKAKTKRRLVFGLNETKRHLKNKKVKVLLLGQDMEVSIQAIKETVDELFYLCSQANVNSGSFDGSCIPIVTGLSSRQIGKALGKKVKVSIVGLINVDGANREVKEFLKAFSKLKNNI